MRFRKIAAGFAAIALTCTCLPVLSSAETLYNGSTVAAEGGYLFHSTYEDGVDGWAARGNPGVDVTVNSAYSGAQSLAVTGRNESWEGAMLTLGSDFVSGKSYSFSAMVMYSSGEAEEDISLTIQYRDTTDEEMYYLQVASKAVKKNQWTQLANTSFAIPATASEVAVYVETPTNLIDFYVDEVIGAADGTVIDAKPLLIGNNQRGDVNNDGYFDVIDSCMAKSGLMYGFTDSAEKRRADVDGDKEVTAADIKILSDFILGNIDKLPEVVSTVDTEKMEKIFSSIKLASSYKGANDNNPLYTQRFGADPGVMVYDGRVYVYTTNDVLEYGSNGSVVENTYAKINKINCISSADLVNWTDHGAIPVAGSSGYSKWGNNSWAPTACHKKINGKEKFFLYFANGGNGIGVLTADTPYGPWTDPIGRALISRSTPNCSNVDWLFDPAVLVDDDGTGYLYFGGGVPSGKQANPGTGRVAKLGADMTSVSGTPQALNAPYLFEDSCINKIGNTYYYSYCSNWDTAGNNMGITSGAIEYCTSSSPMGPFTYKGEIFKNIGNFFGTYGNNHHTLIEFKGQYYLFYHSQAVQQAMKLSGNYRSPQIDKVTVSNGTIGTIKGTMSGVPAVDTLNPYETVQAETMAIQAGINVREVGNTVVTEINAGDWIGLKNVAFTNGASNITVKVSSKKDCAIKICTGSASGKVVGYVDIPSTGGSFTEITAPVDGLSGTQSLFFVFSDTMEFDSWSFS